jgi:hypothetical protein
VCVAAVHGQEGDVEVLNVAMGPLECALCCSFVCDGRCILLIVVLDAVVDSALASAVPITTL